MTIREALARESAVLKTAGIDSAALDASLLLAEVLNRRRSSLIAAGQETLPGESLAAFRRLIQRRRSGECAAYILGKKEFHGMEFTVNPAVLVPRPDTEILVEAALEFAHNTAVMPNIAHNSIFRVFDLCTGSGAIAITLKHELPELEVWASDISAAALETAKTNAERLIQGGGFVKDGQLHPFKPIHFLHGDLFEALQETIFSLIVSNPPYIPSAEINTLSREVQNEPILALDGGSDGLAIIKKIIAAAPDHLLPGGALFLEADPRQMHSIAALLAERGFGNIKTYRDLSGQERVITGALPAGI